MALLLASDEEAYSTKSRGTVARIEKVVCVHCEDEFIKPSKQRARDYCFKFECGELHEKDEAVVRRKRVRANNARKKAAKVQ